MVRVVALRLLTLWFDHVEECFEFSWLLFLLLVFLAALFFQNMPPVDTRPLTSAVDTFWRPHPRLPAQLQVRQILANDFGANPPSTVDMYIFEGEPRQTPACRGHRDPSWAHPALSLRSLG